MKRDKPGKLRPEFDSWEAHGGVWSASRLRQNKHLRVREGRFEPKRLDTWISEICLPTARADEYYWRQGLACVATEARRWVGPDPPATRRERLGFRQAARAGQDPLQLRPRR